MKDSGKFVRNLIIPFLIQTWLRQAIIYHDISINEHVVYVRLKGGNYNLWWHIRKDEAKAKNKISWHDLHHLDDWELKNRLSIPPY